MTILVCSNPSCRKQIAVPDWQLGEAVRCSQCGRPFGTPGAAGDAPVPQPKTIPARQWILRWIGMTVAVVAVGMGVIAGAVHMFKGISSRSADVTERLDDRSDDLWPPSVSTQQILGHPFWKKRPTEKALNHFLDLLGDPQAQGRVGIDENGVVWGQKDLLDPTPPNVSRRHVLVRAVAVVQYDRPRQLGYVKSELDRVVSEEQYERKLFGK
jgi:hypothetical protein